MIHISGIDINLKENIEGAEVVLLRAIKMDVLQKTVQIKKLISTFSDDKVAISVVISDKSKCFHITGHSGLSSVISSRLSDSVAWNINDNQFSDNIIYPQPAKPFSKLLRDEMRQLLSVIIRAEQNHFGRKCQDFIYNYQLVFR